MAVRILLVIIGVLVLAGMMWWERQSSIPHKRRDRDIVEGMDLTLHVEGEEPFVDFSELGGLTATGVASVDTPSESLPVLEEKIVVINLVAPTDQPYAGIDVLTALQGARLVYGEMSIFHHRVKTHHRPVFSMANLVEPGTFHPPSMDRFITPGLTLFMSLPCHVSGTHAFEQMLASAQHLFTELGGHLCDQRRRPLDKQAIAKLRTEVSQYLQRIDGI